MILASVGTLGVCLFAAISGYACFGDDHSMPAKILRRLKKALIITVSTIVFYTVFSFFIMRSTGELSRWKSVFSNPVSYMRMLVFGDFDFMYASFIWYMVALIYCYVIFYFLIRYNLKKLIIFLFPLMMAIRITVFFYIQSAGANWHISSNFLVAILPLMMLGYVIAEKKDKLIQIPTSVLISGSAISAVEMFVTVCVKFNGFNISNLFTILCISFVFVLGIKKPEWQVIKIVSRLGREDSLCIYLIHTMIILILRSVLNSLQLSAESIIVMLPLLSVLVSIIAARIIMTIISKVKTLKKANI